MKQSFSTNWKASTQPRKQRKYQANSPYHTQQKYMHAPLSKTLREKHGTRSVGIRSGDKVKITRGQFKGQSGKIDRVNVKSAKVFVTGIELIKKDGNKVLAPLVPSNLQLTELTDEKRRFKNKEVKAKPAVAKPATPSQPKKEASQ